MPKFVICPECEGSGSSSAHLGSFTGDEMQEQGVEFIEDYINGRYDRNCDECQGKRVVTACQTEGCNEPQAIMNSFFGGREVYKDCWEHSPEAKASAEVERESAAERRFGC